MGSDSNQLDDLFEMNQFARDKEIAKLKKEINEANSKLLKSENFDFYKCDDILRSSANLDISKKLEELDNSLSTIVDKITKTQKEIQNDESTRPKADVIDSLKQKLAGFVDLRNGMRYLNIDYEKLSTTYSKHAERLVKLREQLRETVEKKNEYDSEMPEPKILGEFGAEIDLEIERFVRFLHALFDSFAYIQRDESTQKTLLSINADDSALISDVCHGLQILDSFDEKFLSLIDVVWSDFCETIMSAADPQAQLTIVCVDNKNTQFTANTQFAATEKQNPAKLLQSLEMFFTALHNVLDEIKVGSHVICSIVGANLGGRLVEKFVLRLCAAAANTKILDEEKSKKLQKLVEDFDAFMKRLGFFVDSTFSAREVFSRSSRLIVNQRCRVFLASARAQVFKPSIELVRVKGVDYDWAKDEAEIADQLEELSLKKEELTQGMDSEKFFAFQECSISASTQKIVSIFGELLKLSNESQNEMEALSYFQAALVIIDTFLVSTPRLHQQTLLTIPQSGALFYNNCHYIFHALMCYKMRMKSTKMSSVNLQYYDFGQTFQCLRQSAVKILDHHVTAAKRQLSTTLSTDDIFTNIESKKSTYDRTLNACTMQIEQLASVWKEVMANVVFEISIGALVAHLLHLLSNIVLSKEDITESDAQHLGGMFPQVLAKLRTLMKINDEEGIYVVCRTQYFRINEIVFCLNSSLAEISDRWCSGIGPLALWMKPFEVRGMICALFQNTSRRAAVLEQIKTVKN